MPPPKILKPAQCRHCPENFGTGRDAWHKWAQHVIKLVSVGNIAHKPSYRFAQTIIRDEERLNRIKDLPNKRALTEQEKINKESTFQELSGQAEYVDTVCPHCHQKTRSHLPLEFTRSGHAWKIEGVLVFMCAVCRGEKKR